MPFQNFLNGSTGCHQPVIPQCKPVTVCEVDVFYNVLVKKKSFCFGWIRLKMDDSGEEEEDTTFRPAPVSGAWEQ